MLSAIFSRRSLSPKRLGPPAPSAAEVTLMIAAAATAPDHGRLRPWRFLVVAEADREALADLFAKAVRARVADPPSELLARERDKATKPPLTIVVVVRLGGAPEVPVEERWVSAGAATQNLLLAVAHLGYAGTILSGERTRDPVIRAGLDIGDDEAIVGFVAIGTPVEHPAPRERQDSLPMAAWPPRRHEANPEEGGAGDAKDVWNG
jgi:nitroreductase